MVSLTIIVMRMVTGDGCGLMVMQPKVTVMII
jgi:hypothetical protein